MPVKATNLNTERKSFTKEDFRKRAWDDHAFFCKELFPNRFFVPFAWIHKQMMQSIFSKWPYVCVIAPRKMGKTPLICFSLPIKSILYNTETYIVIISETMAESRKHVQRITSELETNEKIHYYFGQFVQRNQHETQKESVQFANRIWLVAKSYLSQIRGTTGQESPPSLIIIDDPQSNKDVKTEMAITNAVNWFEDEVMYSKAQKWRHPHHGYIAEGRIRFLGTSLHPLCLAEKLYADSRFKSVRFSALMDADGKPDLVNGTSAWEDMFPTAELRREMRAAEANGRLANWLQERMNQPYAFGSRKFYPENMRYWNLGSNRFDVIDGIPVLVMDEALELELGEW